MLGVVSRHNVKKLASIDIEIEIYNQQVLRQVLLKLNKLPEIIDARQLHIN